jgi:Tripartite tricarboxylate transporter TctB family
VDRVAARSDAVSGVALVVLAVVYSASARGLPAGTTEPGPGFFPRILAWSLALLGVVILVRGIRSNERRSGSGSGSGRGRGRGAEGEGERENERVDGGETRTRLTHPLLLAAATFAYIPGFVALGFVAATLALSGLAAAVISGGPYEAGSRRKRPSKRTWIVVPLITTLILYAIFQIALGVPLPSGDLLP